ncbi:PVC-type heme-binding CxxCH protein, partial [Symmachiella dynata]|uniref:PVC-type heme-binding CxxCH protein n=1 Tax=Symmachiella dynata TaxID=2527995 RepID=UPI0030ED025C
MPRLASRCHLLLLAVVVFLPDNLTADEPVSLTVPEGFTATLFADDDLAHDVFSMTFDSQGRLVVSGRGYVKRLIDSDGDGRADEAQQFVDGPESGAQGMYFHGDDLLCVDAKGLLRYRDQDADGVADGPPDRFLKTKVGGEHGPHAIRKGPDGWWYLIAGNMSGVNDEYVTLPRSPVKHPRAGVVMRLKPNLTGGEVFADGFRNAYDFDFNEAGDLFTFDSDGEREVSLPWYRPTRVFHVVPGGDAGWVSRNWKFPDYFLDMPPVVGAFGRGSPSGVVSYRHTQFPEQYRGALFVEDWTFGRVIAMPLAPEGSTYSSEPVEFITGKGEFGFAPTDIEVGPDGSLYVSVGGRGTRGGVYRIQYDGDEPKPETAAAEGDAQPDAETAAES